MLLLFRTNLTSSLASPMVGWVQENLYLFWIEKKETLVIMDGPSGFNFSCSMFSCMADWISPFLDGLSLYCNRSSHTLSSTRWHSSTCVRTQPSPALRSRTEFSKTSTRRHGNRSEGEFGYFLLSSFFVVLWRKKFDKAQYAVKKTFNDHAVDEVGDREREREGGGGVCFSIMLV